MFVVINIKKRILFLLISALTLSTSVNAEVSDEMQKKCLEARDYEGCVKTHKNYLTKKIMKYQGLE